MADLPPSSLRLHHPAFYSTGVDCSRPYLIKIGRRTKKNMGHSVCMSDNPCPTFWSSSQHGHIWRWGKPFELVSDQGTSLKVGSSELKDAFKWLTCTLQSQLASQQINFQCDPPYVPHCGCSWERELRTIKSALHITLGSQTVTEEVLTTLLIEVEGIVNSKSLGYTLSDVADPDHSQYAVDGAAWPICQDICILICCWHNCPDHWSAAPTCPMASQNSNSSHSWCWRQSADHTYPSQGQDIHPASCSSHQTPSPPQNTPDWLSSDSTLFLKVGGGCWED